MSTIDSGHCGDGVARRKKRLWTDEEKRSICFQTTAPGVSVAQVARRYAVNANLIFKWLRDPRFAPDPAAVPSPAVEPRFLPVEIVAEAQAPTRMKRLRPYSENTLRAIRLEKRLLQLSFISQRAAPWVEFKSYVQPVPRMASLTGSAERTFLDQVLQITGRGCP